VSPTALPVTLVQEGCPAGSFQRDTSGGGAVGLRVAAKTGRRARLPRGWRGDRRYPASQWRLEYLTATFAETTTAVVTLAGRALPEELVATQGHVLSVGDLFATLVVEATIHHLDMTVDLDSAGPHPEPVAITRDTVDGLLGRSTPEAWNNEQWVRAATGRAELLVEQRSYLGSDVKRLPLLR